MKAQKQNKIKIKIKIEKKKKKKKKNFLKLVFAFLWGGGGILKHEWQLTKKYSKLPKLFYFKES